MVEIDGVPYLDGGIADSIPLIHAMEKGYRKNVVILTRNMGYRKKKPGKSTPLYVAAFRHYPEFLNTLYNRYRSYNRTLELLEKWEREGHILSSARKFHCGACGGEQREADGVLSAWL